jgi:hypothetical protein
MALIDLLGTGRDNHMSVRLAAQINKRQRVARADESARKGCRYRTEQELPSTKL